MRHCARQGILRDAELHATTRSKVALAIERLHRMQRMPGSLKIGAISRDYDVIEEENGEAQCQREQQSSRRDAAKFPPTHGLSNKSRLRLRFRIRTETLTKKNEFIDTLLLSSDIHFRGGWGNRNSA